jgi:hypothetical protein
LFVGNDLLATPLLEYAAIAGVGIIYVL